MSSTSSPKEPPHALCVICGGESYGLHFGAESCRACAAFFRRTVALKLGYQCRSGGNCEIRKDFRCLCRFCRYKKCLAIGMKPENVQLNRFDPLPSYKNTQPPMEEPMDTVSSSFLFATQSFDQQKFSKSPISAIEADSSSSTLHSFVELPKPIPICVSTRCPPDLSDIQRLNSLDSSLHNSNIMNSAMEAKVQMMSIFNKAPISNPQSIMESMLTSYDRLVQKRNIFRMTICNRQKSLSEIFNGLNAEKLTVKNIEKFDCKEHVASSKFEVLLFAEFCMELKYFSNLTIDQKFFIFKHCWRQLLMIDKAYETIEYLGYDEEDKRLIIYNLKAFHVQDVSCNDVDAKNLDVFEIHRLFNPSVRYMYDTIVKPLKQLKPSLFEFLAMVGMIMWKLEGVNEIDPEIKKISIDAKNEILQAVHEYFVNVIQLPAYALRLAAMIEEIGAVEKTIGQRIQEDMVLAQLFDVFKCDVFLSNFLD